MNRADLRMCQKSTCGREGGPHTNTITLAAFLTPFFTPETLGAWSSHST